MVSVDMYLMEIVLQECEEGKEGCPKSLKKPWLFRPYDPFLKGIGLVGGKRDCRPKTAG